MAEFCGPDFPVRLASFSRFGVMTRLRLKDLLPKAFRFGRGLRR
jgi:cytidine deaminase